ncbi:MAG TPA: hypothetical protein VGN61_02375, partial [Verrucomicrobiae bacterium]|jgi:hypothetical protein
MFAEMASTLLAISELSTREITIASKERFEALMAKNGGVWKYVNRLLDDFSHEIGSNGFIIDCPPHFLKAETDNQSSPNVAIIGLNLIDVANVSIEKLTAFRNDSEARDKMRKFRLFVYDNYTGKEKGYIEDDILTRLADYNEVVKSWGFETKLKTMSFVLNSKLLPTALGASFLASIFGSTVEAIAAASTGVGLEIGRLTLELSKRKHELARIVRNNPISYIADAKAKLDDKSVG